MLAGIAGEDSPVGFGATSASGFVSTGRADNQKRCHHRLRGLGAVTGISTRRLQFRSALRRELISRFVGHSR